jgi:hypothetical protein
MAARRVNRWIPPLALAVATVAVLMLLVTYVHLESRIWWLGVLADTGLAMGAGWALSQIEPRRRRR